MRKLLFIFIAFFSLLIPQMAKAHEVRPALLKLTEISEYRYLVIWRIPALKDRQINIGVDFPAQCSENKTNDLIFSKGAATHNFIVECPFEIAGKEIHITNLAATMLDVMVNIDFLDGQKLHHLIRPVDPTYLIPKTDNKIEIMGNYIMLGIEHILAGWDHLLFVMGLVLLLQRWRPILGAVSGFTVAHSITLCLLALGYIQISVAAVETIIALSIVILAVEILKNRTGDQKSLIVSRPWLICGLFGLFHGLGFASALAQYGLPEHARIISLISFNIGVEIGQVLFMSSLLACALLLRFLPPKITRIAQLGSIWFIGTMGAYWFIERFLGIL